MFSFTSVHEALCLAFAPGLMPARAATAQPHGRVLVPLPATVPLMIPTPRARPVRARSLVADSGMVLTVALSLLAPRALEAQREPRSFIRVEIGKAEIHRASNSGAMLGLRLGRRVDAKGVARLELGSSYSDADKGYVVLEAGAELRPLARYRVTPIVGVGAGFLVEPNFRGEMLRGTLVLEVEVAVRMALRLGAQLGYHGGEPGPHTFFFGIETRMP